MGAQCFSTSPSSQWLVSTWPSTCEACRLGFVSGLWPRVRISRCWQHPHKIDVKLWASEGWFYVDCELIWPAFPHINQFRIFCRFWWIWSVVLLALRFNYQINSYVHKYSIHLYRAGVIDLLDLRATSWVLRHLKRNQLYTLSWTNKFSQLYIAINDTDFGKDLTHIVEFPLITRKLLGKNGILIAGAWLPWCRGSHWERGIV